MMRDWRRSLQLRLALRVAALYIAATIVVIAILMSRAFDTARSLSDRELIGRATEIAKYVTADENGRRRVDLPPKLSGIYDNPNSADIFAMRDAEGRVIAASQSLL